VGLTGSIDLTGRRIAMSLMGHYATSWPSSAMSPLPLTNRRRRAAPSASNAAGCSQISSELLQFGEDMNVRLRDQFAGNVGAIAIKHEIIDGDALNDLMLTQ
jgi:hypothetical protein